MKKQKQPLLWLMTSLWIWQTSFTRSGWKNDNCIKAGDGGQVGPSGRDSSGRATDKSPFRERPSVTLPKAKDYPVGLEVVRMPTKITSLEQLKKEFLKNLLE